MKEPDSSITCILDTTSKKWAGEKRLPRSVARARIAVGMARPADYGQRCSRWPHAGWQEQPAGVFSPCAVTDSPAVRCEAMSLTTQSGKRKTSAMLKSAPTVRRASRRSVSINVSR